LHKLAYDSARGVIVLFGGHTLVSGYYDDTWEWDGVDWVQRTPAHSPSARFSHSLSFDSERAVTVLYGGFNDNEFGDVWEWDGVDWIERIPTV